MFKSTLFQEYLILEGVIAFVLSSLLTMTCMPLVAILGGFFGSVIISRLLFKKQWAAKDDTKTTVDSLPKRIIGAFVVAAIASQMGWCALLV